MGGGGGGGHNKNTNTFSQIGINVTNEMGQVRILDGRDVENNNEDQQDDTEHHGNSKVSVCVEEKEGSDNNLTGFIFKGEKIFNMV